MLKTKKEIVFEEVDVVKDVICNMCGKPCVQPFNGQWEYGLLSANWGYGSNRDGRVEKSHICPDCYEDLVDLFVIKPTCEGNDGFIAYDEDYEDAPDEALPDHGGDLWSDQQQGITLNEEQWEKFNEKLEAPPQTSKRMERLLNEPSILEEDYNDGKPESNT